MLKWIGILALSTATTLFGNFMAAQLQESAKLWEQSTRLAEGLSTRLNYTLAPIPTLLADLAKTGDFTAFPFLEQIAQSGEEEWKSLWEREIRRLRRLSTEETEMLLSFLKPLGQIDLAGQTVHCRSFAKRFEEKRVQAERTRKEKGRLYPLLGLLGGLAAALLLI